MADLSDVKLSSEDILKKTFRNKVKGYDPTEVDTYLDQIISDYEVFQQIIEDLYGQIGDLQRKLMESNKAKQAQAHQTPAEEEIKTYTPKRRVNPVTDFSSSFDQGEISTNMAIIQRISTLERKVYNLEQKIYGSEN